MEIENLKIRLSLDQPTGNFWIDTGLVVLIRQFGEGDISAQEVLAWLLSRLAQKTGNKGEYYDEATGRIREYEKVNWVYPTNLFIKASGKPGKKVKLNGKSYPTQPPIFEVKPKFSKKPGPCDICGEHGPITDAKMWMYPFVVTPDKFGTFYSGAKLGLKVCARCTLAGLAGYLGWLWKAQGQDALHVFVFHAELRELKRLHEEVLQALRLEGGAGGNAPVAFSGPYLHETTLGLLLTLFPHVRESGRLGPEARQLLAALLGASLTPTRASLTPVTLYALTIKLGRTGKLGQKGQKLDMRALREISRLQQLYWLYESWLEVLRAKLGLPNPQERLAQIFEQFWAQQGQTRETIWREKIAQAVLEFGDPAPFVEQFLYEARAKETPPRPLLRGTLEVFNQYIKEVLGMDEQFLRTLAGFGHALGAAAYEHNEMGLLYSLRNAKNPEEFFRVLNDVQFRLERTVPEALLRIEKGERIAGVPWMRVKTLLSIYALNAYLQRSATQGQKEAKEEL